MACATSLSHHGFAYPYRRRTEPIPRARAGAGAGAAYHGRKHSPARCGAGVSAKCPTKHQSPRTPTNPIHPEIPTSVTAPPPHPASSHDHPPRLAHARARTAPNPFLVGWNQPDRPRLLHPPRARVISSCELAARRGTGSSPPRARACVRAARRVHELSRRVTAHSPPFPPAFSQTR